MLRPLAQTNFQSSFLSVDKDTNLILRKLLIESRPYSDMLKRLLLIPEKDCIIFLTARTEEFRDITEAFLHQQNIRYDEVIFNVPSGERILLNDDKPSGKCMCRAISFPRNGLPMIQVIEDELL